MGSAEKGSARESKSFGLVKFPGKNLLGGLGRSGNPCSDGTLKKAGKERKEKRKLQRQADAAAHTSANGIAESLEQPKKKKKKSLGVGEAPGIEPVPYPEVATTGNPVAIRNSLHKGKKKNKQARQDAAPVIVASPPVEAAQEERQKKEKKKRKKKEAEKQKDCPQHVAPQLGEAGPDKPAGEGVVKKMKRKHQAAGVTASDGQVQAASAWQPPSKQQRPLGGPEQRSPGAGGEGAAEPSKKKKHLKSGGPEGDRQPEWKEAIWRMKWSEAVGVEGPRKWACVGDREAAFRGPPIIKALYRESEEVAAWPSADVDAWRAARKMTVQGSSLKPVPRFELSGLSKEMLEATRTFTAPSPIQAQAWPLLMAGNDLIGIAATGSGKTLAFGLPSLAHLLAQRRGTSSRAGGPGCLVLAPTRELAQQIGVVLQEAGQPCGVSTLTAYGGVPKKEQARVLKKGVDIVVATPGRLQDLVQDGSCRLEGVTYLVLDEADRMLDLGFEPHIRAIASRTRADRQTLMFSATWPAAIRKLASEFLSDPVRITIGSEDVSASHSVSQVVEVMEVAGRDARLLELLRKLSSGTERVLVFVLYKKEAPRVENLLRSRGFKVAAVHGDVSQERRSEAVDNFKAGTVPVLVATDVAARGLDIPDVAAVINYSFPLTIEDYVHRIGRTGRAGKTGVAYTFFCGQNDKARAGELMNVLREAKQPIPPALLRFGSTVKKKESQLYGAHFKDLDPAKKSSKITFDSDDE